jgi:hypothetical protein
LSTQQILADKNTQTIDRLIKTEDAIRLGGNPTLEKVAVNDANGVRTYYYTYDNGTGYKYLYSILMDQSGPVIKTVTVQAGSASHKLNTSKQLRASHKL